MYKLCAVRQSSISLNHRGGPRQWAEPAPIFISTGRLFGRSSTPAAAPSVARRGCCGRRATRCLAFLFSAPPGASTALLIAPELLGRVMADFSRFRLLLKTATLLGRQTKTRLQKGVPVSTRPSTRTTAFVRSGHRVLVYVYELQPARIDVGANLRPSEHHHRGQPTNPRKLVPVGLRRQPFIDILVDETGYPRLAYRDLDRLVMRFDVSCHFLDCLDQCRARLLHPPPR